MEPMMVIETGENIGKIRKLVITVLSLVGFWLPTGTMRVNK